LSLEDTTDDGEDLGEEPVEDPFGIGTFHRLQNCKKEENNKKLVGIFEILGEGSFRVVDKSGVKYKVSASKLKSSIKSFDLEAALKL
jgi:hypothetical protein